MTAVKIQIQLLWQKNTLKLLFDVKKKSFQSLNTIFNSMRSDIEQQKEQSNRQHM